MIEIIKVHRNKLTTCCPIDSLYLYTLISPICFRLFDFVECQCQCKWCVAKPS